MAWSPLLIVAFIGLAIAVFYSTQIAGSASPNNKRSIFEFAVEGIDEALPAEPLSTYKGKKAYLVVNVASKCGLTDKNYAELQELYEKLR